MRLFVGTWLPADVMARVADLPRPDVPGLRWTTADQWHVTLAFLGEVPETDLTVVEGALAGIAGRLPGRPEVALGPTTTMLGRRILCVPVAGLEAAAVEVRRSVLAAYLRTEVTPFRGHLTLARVRRTVEVPTKLLHVPLRATWTVDELCLVSSRLDPRGARYTTVARATVPS